MSQEIAVVGSQEFTTGFQLAGVRRLETVPPEDDDALDDAVETVLDDDNVGIVVMHSADMGSLSRLVRERAETSVEPTVVTVGGGENSGLREQIRRAIGIDLMEE